MLIQTTRFGEVEIQDQDILTFPSGMLGFSSERHFVMIEDESHNADSSALGVQRNSYV